jgi:NADP-dependent 3-hydroxy acid dehydrogenase YdfG
MMEQRLKEQVAIVTGAGRGIGAGIARALAAEGAHVVASARTEQEITAVASSIREAGHSAASIRADVCVPGDVVRLVQTTLDRYGRIDVLVNNAGTGTFKSVMDMSLEEYDAMMNLNMRGVFVATKAVLPAMVKANTGAIINIASLAGKNTIKNGAVYCATKWALRGFAGSLMLEVRDHNIRVCTICPGSVDTSFSPGGKRGGNIPQPEDVASAVIFALTAPERAMFSEIDLRPTRP